MWIKRSRYKQLQELNMEYDRKCSELHTDNWKLRTGQDALMNEVFRLKEIIDAQVVDCNVGPWCNGCIHKGEDQAYHNYEGEWLYGQFVRVDSELGKIIFCKKHLHELCPEFEAIQKK